MNYSKLSGNGHLLASLIFSVFAVFLFTSNSFSQAGCGTTISAEITSNPACGTLPPCDCECVGNVRELTLQYIGEGTVDVNIWNKANHQILVASFSNVVNGDVLTASAVGLLAGDDFETTTPIEIAGGEEIFLNTNCNIDIGGGVYGDFLILGFEDTSDNVCDALTCRKPCDCQGNLEAITLKYLGASGVDINIWRNDAQATLLASYTNVQTGSMLMANGDNLPGNDLDPETNIEIVGVAEINLPTDCSLNPQGEVFGDFEVIAYRDGNGTVCNGYGKGEVELTVDGNGPFTYTWSDGSIGKDLKGAVDGHYDVVVTDANNCAVAQSYDVNFQAFTLTAQGFIEDSTECYIELPKICSCECTGSLTEVTLFYTGTSGVDINVWDNAAHDNLIASFIGVQNSDEISFSAVGVLAGDVLNNNTFVEIVGGEELDLATTCAANIGGGFYGDFQVFGTADNNGGICDASDCIQPCGCDGKVRNMTIQYIGVETAEVNVWSNLAHDVLVDSYHDLNYGDFFFVEAVEELPGGGFGTNTVFEIVGGEEVSIHTSCSIDAIGEIFGPFRVIHYTDGLDATCNELNCDGEIDINVLEGQGPFGYVWSHGARTEDVSGLCPGNYDVEIFDANGCTYTQAFELTCYCEDNDNSACAEWISSDNLPCISGTVEVDATLQCTPITGSLEGATNSPEAVGNVPTGEDRWYMFTAVYPGVSIRVESEDFDVLVELFDREHNLLDSEDKVEGIGTEVLNFGLLTENESYLLAVRAVDGFTGTGDFSVCISNLPDSRCDRFGEFDLCDTFKADWVCADDYIFHYTSLTTGELTVYQMGYAWTFMQLIDAPLYGWDDEYLVEIYAMYHIENGNHETEYIVVDNDEPCTIITNPHPITQLDYSDRCEINGPQFMGGYIAATPWACAAVDYTWEFVRTDVPELPIYHERGAANRYMQISDVPGLVFGGEYEVRVKPEFITGEDTNWGPVQCMSIIGSAGAPELAINKPALEEDMEKSASANMGANMQSNEKSTTETFVGEEAARAAIYPNPVKNGYFTLNMTGFASEKVVLEIRDVYGKLISGTEIMTPGGMVNEIVDAGGLAQGLYNVVIIDGNSQLTLPLVVAK